MRWMTIILFTVGGLSAQNNFPYSENFDSVSVPLLPSGWLTTKNKSVVGDFTSVSTTSRSLPNSIISSDARVLQILTTPKINFTNKTAETISFFERRSASHNSAVLLEYAFGDDTIFTKIGDTLINLGTTNYVERIFQLPDEISNKPEVKFRVKILGNGSGATGTIRIDDFLITTKKIVDLSISYLKTIPTIPRANENFSIEVIIKNLAEAGNFNYNLKVFISEKEVFSNNYILTLNKNDSITKNIGLQKLPVGTHSLKIKISALNDEDSLNDISNFLQFVAYSKKSLIINEFMYSPVGDEPEWVEVFNASNDTINLKNWRVQDATKSFAVICDSNNFIFPNEIFVVARDSTIKNYYNYNFKFFVVPIPTLNNSTADAIVLKDFTDLQNDSIYYFPTWGGINGKSLEKIDYAISGNDSSNWISSIPSCGKINFNSRKNYDLSLTKSWYERTSKGFNIFATIKNIGRINAENSKFELSIDGNKIVYFYNIPTINPLDSNVVSFHWEIGFSGSKIIYCKIIFPDDDRIENNFSELKINSSFKMQSLVINEIMFDPAPQNSEFIELYNSSSDTINLSEWKVSDSRDLLTAKNIFTLNGTISPKDYFIISADSNIYKNFPSPKNIIILNKDISLNNDGDFVAIFDLTNSIIDSVNYSNSWHLKNKITQNRSLEKISPLLNSGDQKNWSTCVNNFGATPGFQNSIFLEQQKLNSEIFLSPNPFSPDFDGFEDNLSISYNFPLNSTTVKIKIFDSSGRLVKNLVDNKLSSSTGTIIWNGLNNDGNKSKIGPHIILIEALDNFGNTVLKIKKVVIVATKL